MLKEKGRLFLNKKAYQTTSESDRQRVVLTGLGASIVVVVCLFFVVVEVFIGELFFIPFYGAMILFSLISILLLRNGNLDVAKIVFIAPVLLVIALLASIEKQVTGVYLYFLAACVYVVTIFGYEKIKYSVMFFLITVVLAFISYFYNLEIIDPQELSQEYIDTSYITNFVVSLFSSLLAIYFLMRLNIKSNEHLIKTSNELRESENKFQLAIKGSSAGIWEWDCESDQITVSPKLAALLGYDSKAVGNLTMDGMLSFIHPEDLQSAKGVLINHFKKREPFRIECRAKSHSGEYIWVLDTGQAEWDSNGHAVRMVGTILNIDERKRAESQIREQNDKLAKANEELDRFVYSTSHDLKAPLSSVQGLISIAELTEDSEERAQCFNLMKNRISNLNSFIADITNYSRNSRLGLHLEEVNLDLLVKEVLMDIEHFKEREKIDITTNLAQDFMLMTDRKRLKVIFSNLLNNAIKYHNYEQDHPAIQITGHHESERSVLQVIDNGSGISEEHQTNIFDMFYRATEKSDGSGLGLYIVKETVEKLNGGISLQSQMGMGSTFTLSLPILNPSN